MRRGGGGRGPDPGRFRTIHYDLLKELTVALGIISVLVIGLAAVLSSPASACVSWASRSLPRMRSGLPI